MKSDPVANLADIGDYDTIIDVRSPSEFSEDHIPGAISCPVLDDAERAEVGTIYKQQSPFEARKIGAALVSANIARHLRAQFLDKPRNWRPLVYCWRGGQRSGAMTTVLGQVGWQAAQLVGGYKAYRRAVVTDLESIPASLSLTVISGSTGTGKTRLLHALASEGEQVIDLEALAAHKGSVLGLVPSTVQPSQKLFESLLLQALRKLDPAREVFVEAESRKIGRLHVPGALMEHMRAARYVSVEVPLAARVDFLLRDYDYLTAETDYLIQRLAALRPLRGNETVDRWCALAKQGKWREFVAAILEQHYDPLYSRSQELNYAGHKDCRKLQGESLDEAGIRLLAYSLTRHKTDTASCLAC
jgi:tRNA 2-selenouridine synthase